MKRIFTLILLLMSLLIFTPSLLAGELKTITLNVKNMTCSMCPITVKKAIREIDGVTKVVAKYEGDGNGWAKITYDPSKADVDDLTFATEEAGYPSQLKK